MDQDRATLIDERWLAIDELKLPLRRFSAPPLQPLGVRQSVLLLHGGNTSSELYHWPRGGLVKYLAERNCDVWTLDWRTSAPLLSELVRSNGPLFGDVQRERRAFTLDRVAEAEIPAALAVMRKTQEVTPEISVLGFCLSAGALAMSIARGHLESHGVGNVVLSTMGLFYEVPWNGWVKAEDFILERILSSNPECRAIDPFFPSGWPDPMTQAYKRWPAAWLGASGSSSVDELFKRLTFCYGEPYARSRLDSAFERRLDSTDFFGPIHLGLFLHAGQMVRRGYAARYGALDVLDRTRISRRSQLVPGHDLIPTYFRNKRVTALTGSDDRLWHRDSIDLMYEWLRNEATDPVGDPRFERQRHRKYIVPRYGHLDIFWGEQAFRDAYPAIHTGLTLSGFQKDFPLAAE